MKLTETKLKQIIREERDKLNEKPTPKNPKLSDMDAAAVQAMKSGKAFYKKVGEKGEYNYTKDKQFAK